MRFRFAAPWLAVAVASSVVGCAHKAVKKGASPGSPGANGSGVGGPESVVEAGEPDLRGLAMRGVDALKTVNFDYDSSKLTPPALAILKSGADWLKANPEVRVQVAGHCDQRGTVEYNIALGQRRAKAVREYYKLLGIPGGRIATISYGKERTLCAESTEECWKKNRRAQTLEAFPQDVSSHSRNPGFRR